MAVLRMGFVWAVARQAPPPPAPLPRLLKESPRNFTITRRPPLLVTPNRPTPTQPLYLTNLDDSFSSRVYVDSLLFYPPVRPEISMNSNGKNDQDPVEVIGEALAKILVDYYPFAGRLRNAPKGKGKLIIDCTGEGVLFVEADADVSLEDLGDLSPPIPRAFEFINNAPESYSLRNSPLLLCQVTRLKCGGFILGLHFSHCIADGAGIAQFVMGLSEIARGAATPTVPPVWKREILRPRAQPTVKSPAIGRLYYDFVDKYRKSVVPVRAGEGMSSKWFYFGPEEIGALKRQAKEVRHCTTFEVIAGCLWQSRVKALNIPAHQDSALLFSVNARSRFRPRLPTGYYGNVVACGHAIARAGDLIDQPLSFAVKLINEGKKMVDEEYVRSTVDLAELNGRPLSPPRGCYIISDVSDLVVVGANADFGWGKAVYVSPASSPVPNLSSLMRASKDDCEGIRVPVCLPSEAMKIFEENIYTLINCGLRT
eukprot:PITA_10517